MVFGFQFNKTQFQAEMRSTKSQVPFALTLALTRLAKQGGEAIQKAMPEVFDRPTPFSLRAVTYERATKSELVAVVRLKQSEDAAGRSVNEHLRPGALGSGARAQKKTEYLLTKLGDLPPGWVTVPGPNMPKDAFGNMPGSIYKQIVNVLQLKVRTSQGAKPVSKASQNRAAKLGVAAEIFAVPPGRNKLGKGGGSLPPGVYKHLRGRALQRMLKFVRSAQYSQRLNMDSVVAQTVARELETVWQASVAQAFKTAKP